jgi:hypothetical protein
MVGWSCCLGLWQHRTPWLEHVVEKAAYLMPAGKQREEKAQSPYPFKGMAPVTQLPPTRVPLPPSGSTDQGPGF